MWRVFIQQNRTFGPLYRRMSRYPGWVTRTATLCAVVTVVIPLIVLMLIGMLVGLVAFVVLALLAKGLALIGHPAGMPTGQREQRGRVNVRVMDRE